MLALVVYTALCVAGLLVLVHQHGEKGGAFVDDYGDNPVLTVFLMYLMQAGLVWWIFVSIPVTWATWLLVGLSVVGFILALGRAQTNHGRFVRTVAGTVASTVISAVVLWGLWSALF